MKNINKIVISLISVAALMAYLGLGLLSTAEAAVFVTSQPGSMVTNPIVLPPNSQPTAIFSFSLSANAGETLSSVTVQVNRGTSSTTVVGGHLGSLSIYRDNGDALFNPSNDTFLGSQSLINIGSPTTITPSSATSASGTFFVTLTTSAFWSSSQPADSITVTFPSNGIITSSNSPVTSQVTTAQISAAPVNLQLLSAAAQNTGGTAAKEAGDSIVLSFSQQTNRFGVNSSNIVNQFVLNNGHSLTDSAGNIQSAVWDPSGQILTISLSVSSGSVVASVSPGDVISMSSATSITDTAGNRAVGSALITGSFGNFPVVGITQTLSANGAPINTPVFDSASLQNTTPNASGTVTYNVFASLSCAGTPVFSSAQTVTNGVVPPSTNFMTTATGTYTWQASYSGDANNNSATSTCDPELVGVFGGGITAPPPAVAGASTTAALPVTGMPVALLLLILMSVGAVLNTKLQLI